jgi:hypothetical protein
LDTRLSAFRFLAFLPFVLGNARSKDREDTGVHRRHSLAKIGAESKEFLPRDDDSGADRIARTRRLVIAGLDPAISMTMAGLCQMNRDDRDIGERTRRRSSNGLCPAMTDVAV